ncbi:MAG: hypothetical protein U9R50_11645, partial [Campylobacterota bacterium]|nr:hypothetical protein [Campylobacterota bacterium]
LVNKIASEKLFKKEDAANWFNEAISLSQKEAALTFIQPLYRVNSDLYWLEQCLYLSTELKNETEKKYCVNKLATMDTTRSEKWLKTAYQVSVASNNLAESLVLISQLATIDPKYLEEYARLELMVGNYIISSELYMQCFYNTKSHRKKGKFLLKALRSLQNGNLLNEVVVLAKKHENLFVRNTKVSSEIMKIYLAAGKLDSAKNYAAKVLKAKEK